MARKIIEHITDDLDGRSVPTDQGGEVSFSLDGIEYAIDLSHRNADDLRDALAPYIAVARQPTRAGRGWRGR
ncbi:histone-like nucleoid-structuring protein Lsr2 [Brevibacterium sp.]|uniref:Lsr2 dimerization domain-containing protein n=1 Tax=Brevibacterium sp. TaxID=1701 RepID=UPI00281265FA|nr:histone-like nucleoid-structuring protein Lsr2 [Brevibacterium sp.]